MILEKPKQKDLPIIKNILSQWTETEEVEKYLERIKNEINNVIEYHTYFWVIKNDHFTVGVIGISDPLPKTLPFSTGKNPIELKILYLDNQSRGLGLGKNSLIELESIIKKNNYDEVLIRSAKRYENTAWAFYEKVGYKQVGTIDEGMSIFRKNISS